METLLTRWGNSLGVRIPKVMATDVGLSVGDTVCITNSNGAIIIKKSRKRPVYCLADLVSQITDENRHDATDWGEPKGREIW